MTYNENHQDNKSCESDKLVRCKQKHPKPKKILLECGEGTGAKTFTSSDDEPFQLAFVSVNTTSINQPKVLIKFSSLVRLEKLEDDPRNVRLKYELFRACNDETPLCLGTWMFEKLDSLSARFNTIQESFSFIFCESSNCLGCCNYFVSVTPLDITNSTAMVSSGQMAALIQGPCQGLEENHKTSEFISDKAQCMLHSMPKNIILACGQGNGGASFKETTLNIPVEIAHVNMDTSRLKNPKVLIEFSSLIKLSEDIDEATIQYQLFRVCGDGEPVPLGVWTFDTINSEELISKAFSFIFCECETVSNHCEYFVKVLPIKVDDGENDDVTVYNARMTALAQSSSKSLNYVNNTKTKGKSDSSNCSLCTQPKKILLECGNGTGSKTFTSSSDIPFQLANVTLDTTLLCNPIVNIQFSNIVSVELETQLEGDDAAVQLRYELFRQCDNERPITVGVWEFTMTDEEDEGVRVESSESFDFTFCDCITRPGCCHYFVTVTAAEILEGVGIESIATINNARLAALAQER